MPHWTGFLIVGVLFVLLFGGRGKISSIMGDMGKGITSFRKGLKDESGDDDVADGEDAIDVTPPGRGGRTIADAISLVMISSGSLSDFF